MSDVVIRELPIHKWSRRESLRQSLAPIEQGAARRTVNGELRYLSIPERRKYRTEISGQDLYTGVHQGDVIGRRVTVECAAELEAYAPAGVSQIVLERPARDGGVRVATADGRTLERGTEWRLSADKRTIVFMVGAGDLFVWYQPVLTCLILDFSTDEDANGATASWSLSAEEV